MTIVQSTQETAVLVAIDIAKSRHEVLMETPVGGVQLLRGARRTDGSITTVLSMALIRDLAL